MAGNINQPNAPLSAEEGGKLERELNILKTFFDNPKDLTQLISLGQNMLICPRVPVELFTKLKDGTFIIKPEQQVLKEQQNILGQPLPVCAVGIGNSVDHINVFDYIMLTNDAQPVRTFYLKGVRLDIYDGLSIACVIKNKDKRHLFSQKFKEDVL